MERFSYLDYLAFCCCSRKMSNCEVREETIPSPLSSRLERRCWTHVPCRPMTFSKAFALSPVRLHQGQRLQCFRAMAHDPNAQAVDKTLTCFCHPMYEEARVKKKSETRENRENASKYGENNPIPSMPSLTTRSREPALDSHRQVW